MSVGPSLTHRSLIVVLLAGVMLAGCGAAPSAALVHRASSAGHHPQTHAVHPLPAQSALTVPTGFQAPLRAALQSLHRTIPTWLGPVAPPGAVVDLNGAVTTSGASLTTARQQWQTFPDRRASITLTLSRALATGTNGGPDLPSVGMPVGQPNIVTTTPNVAEATGVVTAGSAAHPFSAIFARLASGWVLVTWRWL